MQLGDVQAFIQYSRQFTMPLAQLGSMANLLQSGLASAERVFSLLDEEEESVEPAASGPVFGRGRLVFESVSFSYSPDKPLISSLSLVAEPGQTVAIVGPTGAGKNHAGEPDDAVLRAGCGADNARRRGRHLSLQPRSAALTRGCTRRSSRLQWRRFRYTASLVTTPLCADDHSPIIRRNCEEFPAVVRSFG
ncbi:hypothetical protein ASG77_03420 [Arthrobacter sp. Soil762]|nr:hypothetical protein ASG77_03420 [Arthrobacter sp. Soil762]